MQDRPEDAPGQKGGPASPGHATSGIKTPAHSSPTGTSGSTASHRSALTSSFEESRKHARPHPGQSPEISPRDSKSPPEVSSQVLYPPTQHHDAVPRQDAPPSQSQTSTRPQPTERHQRQSPWINHTPTGPPPPQQYPGSHPTQSPTSPTPKPTQHPHHPTHHLASGSHAQAAPPSGPTQPGVHPSASLHSVGSPRRTRQLSQPGQDPNRPPANGSHAAAKRQSSAVWKPAQQSPSWLDEIQPINEQEEAAARRAAANGSRPMSIPASAGTRTYRVVISPQPSAPGALSPLAGTSMKEASVLVMVDSGGYNDSRTSEQQPAMSTSHQQKSGSFLGSLFSMGVSRTTVTPESTVHGGAALLPHNYRQSPTADMMMATSPLDIGSVLARASGTLQRKNNPSRDKLSVEPPSGATDEGPGSGRGGTRKSGSGTMKRGFASVGNNLSQLQASAFSNLPSGPLVGESGGGTGSNEGSVRAGGGELKYPKMQEWLRNRELNTAASMQRGGAGGSGAGGGGVVGGEVGMGAGTMGMQRGGAGGMGSGGSEVMHFGSMPRGAAGSDLMYMYSGSMQRGTGGEYLYMHAAGGTGGTYVQRGQNGELMQHAVIATQRSGSGNGRAPAGYAYAPPHPPPLLPHGSMPRSTSLMAMLHHEAGDSAVMSSADIAVLSSSLPASFGHPAATMMRRVDSITGSPTLSRAASTVGGGSHEGWGGCYGGGGGGGGGAGSARMMIRQESGLPPALPICLICLEMLTPQDFAAGEALQLECLCKGEVAMRHRACAIEWSNVKGNLICDICKHPIANLPDIDPAIVAAREEARRRRQPLFAIHPDPTTADYVFDAIRVAWVTIICCILFVDGITMTKTFVVGGCVGLVYCWLSMMIHWAYTSWRTARRTAAYARQAEREHREQQLQQQQREQQRGQQAGNSLTAPLLIPGGEEEDGSPV